MSSAVLAMVPRLKEVVWGSGVLQQRYGKHAPLEARIGESWEVSAVPGWESGVEGSPSHLRQHFEAAPRSFLGAPGGFPVLVKLLATSQRLSLQVHPDARRARELEGHPRGKHESWLVLEAEPGACLYLGLADGAGLPELEAAVRSGEPEGVERLLRRVPAAAGEVYDVPPGTLHAVGAGLTLLEVQEPSALTYRLHDWGRPRQVHVQKALAVADPELRPRARRPEGEGLLLEHEAFRLERLRLDAGSREVPVEGLMVLVCLEGRGTASGGGSRAGIPLERGRSCVVPFAAKVLRLEGRGLDLAVVKPPR